MVSVIGAFCIQPIQMALISWVLHCWHDHRGDRVLGMISLTCILHYMALYLLNININVKF
uniref:Uncharacterized protein n=1 Tax=Anguilla anguilla TaxID=7936 RepID=A0A0E9WL24_ANGAN